MSKRKPYTITVAWLSMHTAEIDLIQTDPLKFLSTCLKRSENTMLKYVNGLVKEHGGLDNVFVNGLNERQMKELQNAQS